MSTRLSDAIVRDLPLPAKGNKVTYDSDIKGFGVRITAAGARSFVLNYRTRSGRERRYTLGSFPDWKTRAARDEAANLKKQIDVGHDPMAKLQDDRSAKTLDDLCDRFITDYLPKKRPATARDYKAIIEKHIRPALKYELVGTLRHDHVDDLHRKITKGGAAYVANRTVAVLSKMLNLAAKWGWRTGDNPSKGIERNPEKKRKRYLSAAEIGRLLEALDGLDDQQSANIVRLLMLTGARRGEALSARWDQFKGHKWVKPGATTKQKTDHEVPLSAPALLLIERIRENAEKKMAKTKQPISDYLFPGHAGVDHQTDVKRSWAAAIKAAKLPGVRLHDLRHTYASVLVSAGQSLPVIGALLGHSQPNTTARYSHLMDDPLKRAADTAGAILSGKPMANLMSMKGNS